jgi:hypothetical protein
MAWKDDGEAGSPPISTRTFTPGFVGRHSLRVSSQCCAGPSPSNWVCRARGSRARPYCFSSETGPQASSPLGCASNQEASGRIYLLIGRHSPSIACVTSESLPNA